jgi:hypothetical protein
MMYVLSVGCRGDGGSVVRGYRADATLGFVLLDLAARRLWRQQCYADINPRTNAVGRSHGRRADCPDRSPNGRTDSRPIGNRGRAIGGRHERERHERQ